MKNLGQIKRWMVTLALALVVVGCNRGNNSSNNSTTPNTGIWNPNMQYPGSPWMQGGGAWPTQGWGGTVPWQSWPGGVMPSQGGQLIASSFGITSDQALGLGLYFYGTTNSWAGQGYAVGELFTTQMAYSSLCPIPPGYYQVAAQNGLTIQGNQFGQLVLIASGQSSWGPVQMQLVLPGGSVHTGARTSPTGGQYQTVLMTSVYVQTVMIGGQYFNCNVPFVTM